MAQQLIQPSIQKEQAPFPGIARLKVVDDWLITSIQSKVKNAGMKTP
jgi:hypothetical protein